MSDDKKKSAKNKEKENPDTLAGTQKTSFSYPQKVSLTAFVNQEAARINNAFADEHLEETLHSFQISRGGKEKAYTVHTGYGYLIPSFRKAENMLQVAKVVEEGLPSEEIAPILDYLGFKVSDIAKAASVSASTVSRWHPKTSIGVPGSNQFFRIDQVIRKGVDLFGDLQGLRTWLQSPNLALGNAVPVQLITTAIGVELVDEALDALHHGNVM
jgi:putative toxin-antitoxin system antitoxin component (TIGR02293 family)